MHDPNEKIVFCQKQEIDVQVQQLNEEADDESRSLFRTVGLPRPHTICPVPF